MIASTFRIMKFVKNPNSGNTKKAFPEKRPQKRPQKNRTFVFEKSRRILCIFRQIIKENLRDS